MEHPITGTRKPNGTREPAFTLVELLDDGGNYAFADGHVSWLKPEAIAEIECKNGPLPFPYRN
jgi:prepilin-type processing-associated H-X9-DG protein